MTGVAIIDYGSGNLHSALKAFERAAREAGLSRDIMVTADPERVAHRDADDGSAVHVSGSRPGR